MSKGIKVIKGISKWVRESVGSDAENRGPDSSENDASEDDENGQSSDHDSPVCCSASSNTDLTVLDP
jgi:hypothetical protein